jgi:hypothetical protein
MSSVGGGGGTKCVPVGRFKLPSWLEALKCGRCITCIACRRAYTCRYNLRAYIPHIMCVCVCLYVSVVVRN